MGQAKQRGSFEERRQQAIIIREEQQRLADEEADRAYAERQRKAKEAWDALTPEQQQAARDKRRMRSITPFLIPALMMGAIGVNMGRRR